MEEKRKEVVQVSCCCAMPCSNCDNDSKQAQAAKLAALQSRVTIHVLKSNFQTHAAYCDVCGLASCTWEKQQCHILSPGDTSAHCWALLDHTAWPSVAAVLLDTEYPH